MQDQNVPPSDEPIGVSNEADSPILETNIKREEQGNSNNQNTCTYRRRVYKYGSIICIERWQYVCNNLGWYPLGKTCYEEKDRK